MSKGSAQEPRMTAFLSDKFANTVNPATGKPCGNKMKEAYLEGKDLYAIIAQSAFNNEYKDNLEFWPEFTKVVSDNRTVIAGNEKSYQIETSSENDIVVPACYLLETADEILPADQLKVGMAIKSDEGLLYIKQIIKIPDKIINNVSIEQIKIVF